MFPDLSADEIVRSLDLAVAETLETMFFADVQPGETVAHAPNHSPDNVQNRVPNDVPNDAANHVQNNVRSILRFEGDESGWLELRLSDSKARELAANFLGVDLPDVESNQVESVCGEMANMVCGAMLSSACPEGHFALGHPELLVRGEGPAEHWLLRSYGIDAEALEIGLASVSVHRAGEQ